ncbi:MAG: DUF6702 family protein [Pseudomonadota bacterium]
MTLRRLRPLLAAALLCMAAVAPAHQFHAGITDISYNERTGSIEVVHTYMAHDIELLLTNLYQRQFDLTDPQDEAILRKYIEKQFYILGRDKARLPLRWIGLTIDAESVVIYQEIEKTPLAGAVRIHDAVIVDFIADQSNTVNLKQGGAIRSLVFDQAKSEQDLQ